MNNKKKKAPWKAVLLIILFLGASFCIGLFIGSVMDPIIDDLPPERLIFGAVGIYIFMLLFSFLHTVLHEAGHLLFGLLTGYTFSSFRVGSFMWVKLNGKLQLKRYSLAGTGGQCLMAPPDMENGRIPYVLYNMGGALVNIVLSLIPLIIVLTFWEPSYMHFVVVLWVVIGLFVGLTNAIPMKLQGMPNDGHNAMSLGKNSEAMQAFWLQMKINEQIAAGKRLKELPKEWFVVPSEEGMQNSLIAAIAVFCCNRLMDEGNYAEADKLMEHLLARESGMVGIHRHILRADQMYCELVGENRKKRYEELYTIEVKQFFKAMKKSPSVFRTVYLYAKYVEKDEKKAEQAMKNFEKVSKTYPYPHEIAGEREMIAYAEEKLASE